jgi:ERF superfamily
MNVPALAQNGGAADAPELRHILERCLRDPSIDLAKLEKMVDLHERMSRWNAETAFNNAMADAQSQIRRVATDKENTQTRGSRYASYAAMDAIIRPVYAEQGFSLQFGTSEGAPENCVRVVCDVAKGGHVKRFHIDMPADGKGARGNDVMTRTHATGSAVTYGRRYLLSMIFNVAVGEGDDDGNGASRKTPTKNAPHDDGFDGEVVSDQQRAQITTLCTELACIQAFLDWAKIESISDLPAAKFETSLKLLLQKKATRK